MLVINCCPLEAGMSHQQALLLLQQPGDTVELVVARDGPVSGPVSASSPRVSTHLSSTVRSSEKPGSPPGGGGPGGERVSVVSLGRGQRSLWPVNL